LSFVVAIGTSRTRQDRAAVAFVRRDLCTFAAAPRERMRASGVDPAALKSLGDLALVEPVELSEVGDGADYVLRPTRRQLLRAGSPYLRLRTAWASTWGRWNAFVHAIDPVYRPVHFFTADAVPVGAAAGDLVRLAGFGAVWLRNLGLTSADSIALVGGAGSGIEAWELSGGSRRAGIPLAVVEEPARAAAHNVTVVAGNEAAVLAALEDGAWPTLRTAIVLGRSAERVEQRLSKLYAQGVVVRRAWAAVGARSVWYECVGGAAQGWHTTPTAELVDRDEHGEIVWTGIGWAGTVFFRLRVDVLADRVETERCPACGHQGPRLFLAPGRPALARFLRADPRVHDVRLTATGAEVLPVRAGAHARLIAEAKKAHPDHDIVVRHKRDWDAQS
jgi:hypothetical protein